MDGYSSKAVSCADGEVVSHSFTTNDCTTVVDVQTVPVTGECCDIEGNCQAAGGDSGADAVATTVECGADGVTQKVYATSDCSGEPMASITAALGECQNPRDGYSSKAVSCADGEVVSHSFTTNDCTTVVDVQTVPVTGECCDMDGNCQASASQAPSGAVAVTVETTVTLTATEDGTFDDAAAVAALADELGVDAERITLVPSFDGTLQAGAEAEVKVVVEVEDGSSWQAVKAKLGELVCETDDCAETDVFGESFEVEAVAAIVVAAAVPPSPPPPSLVSGESQQQAGDVNVLSIVVIVVPVVLVVVIAVLIGVVIYLCCCKGKRATKAPEVEVKMSSTAV
jgi:hypothetical protein